MLTAKLRLRFPRSDESKQNTERTIEPLMYAGTFDILKTYWRAYGGLQALIQSFYLLVAVALLALTFNTWRAPALVGPNEWSAWWDQSISVLPNLLGFTLGGFAIFIGFGDEKFRQLLSEQEAGSRLFENDYVQLCATFVHFIVVQVLALLAAILGKAWWFYAAWMDPYREVLPWLNAVGGALGYGLFLYALTSVLAATMHVFRIATLYAAFQTPPSGR